MRAALRTIHAPVNKAGRGKAIARKKKPVGLSLSYTLTRKSTEKSGLLWYEDGGRGNDEESVRVCVCIRLGRSAIKHTLPKCAKYTRSWVCVRCGAFRLCVAPPPLPPLSLAIVIVVAYYECTSECV